MLAIAGVKQDFGLKPISCYHYKDNNSTGIAASHKRKTVRFANRFPLLLPNYIMVLR